ncbi:hypothetical protein NDU88_005026 [Pleurodeles waltl]|uniref:Uncharacterized protein n=1 Tax=Pleurodeles waltl TaxID=8319 RepID=A0AAV7NLI4_PLEWA|nr:hypothetical protein NDU88_005026 [Pleurodeles waltl]
MVGILNPVREGSTKRSAGERVLRRTATRTDGGVAEMTGEGGLRGTEVCAAKETAVAEEPLETGGKYAPKEDDDLEDTATYEERRLLMRTKRPLQ